MTPEQKAFLDKIEQAVFVLEPDEQNIPRYTAFNTYARGHILRPESEILGATIKDLFPGRNGETIFGHHMHVLETAQPYSYQAHLPLHGDVHQIEVTLRPLLNDAGKVVQIVGTTKDISTLGHLQAMQIGAEIIQGEIEDFVNLAAHDLRTPMRNVTAIAEMLRDDFEDLGDGKLELIDMLEQIATKATSLISDILSHAQATSTKSDIQEFSFEDLGKEIFALLDPLKHCDFHITGGTLRGDRAATLIVLRNLIDNAIKHGKPKDAANGKLQIQISLTPARPGFYAVQVQDNGPGLADPSVALLNTGTLRKDGGFGLFGTRRLVQNRGGLIEAKNCDAGHGAIITFTLPGEVFTQT
ncbi:PAS domain-containing sensor histidine kinase [Phycobacter azelaicus]|uniref:PAS domain-containing sensor histidine kinase n=1 Tax=Phycobacter azelaicus TaxID=2668075 RepID=UPI0018676095|nr:PAS domain-containing sensor histidine kinase [Phycobacter azelaicus]